MDLITLWILIILTLFLFASVMLSSWLLFSLGAIMLVFTLIYNKKNLVQNYYKFEDPKVNELKERIFPIIPEIRHVTLYGSNKSFTIDKRVSYICIKNADGQYYPDNMLIYVILHELAHVLCDEINPPNEEHTPKWEAIFKDLLVRAEKGGIYDSSIPVLSEYCGYK